MNKEMREELAYAAANCMDIEFWDATQDKWITDVQFRVKAKTVTFKAVRGLSCEGCVFDSEATCIGPQEAMNIIGMPNCSEGFIYIKE